MNLFDYLEREGRKSFEELSFNPLDSLCLSLVSYLPLGEYVEAGFGKHFALWELCGLYLIYQEECEARYARSIAKEHTRFFRLLGKSPRFAPLTVTGFCERADEDRQMQFAALTVSGIGGHFVSFRGTDGTLVGWKEDFNMTFLDAVPAQLAAADYLQEAARALPEGSLWVGGHSKGGNLAVFAAASVGMETQSRLAGVFSHDAPGFLPAFLASDGYQTVHALIRSYVPQTSIVGMLLESGGDARVVHSAARGFLQHDPYTWEAEGTDFVYETSTDRRSRYIDRTLSAWLSNVNRTQRESFVDTVYELICATEAQSVNELVQRFLVRVPRVLEKHKKLPREVRECLKDTVERFFRAAWEELQSERETSGGEWRAKLLEAYAPVREKVRSVLEDHKKDKETLLPKKRPKKRK